MRFSLVFADTSTNLSIPNLLALFIPLICSIVLFFCKSFLFPNKYIIISSLEDSLICSCQYSTSWKELSLVISYTIKAPSAFLKCDIVIALNLSAPANEKNNYILLYLNLHVSHICKDILFSFVGSSSSLTWFSTYVKSTPIVAWHGINSSPIKRFIIFVFPTLMSPITTTMFVRIIIN